MSTYTSDIIIATLLFPFVALIFTLPYSIHQYRKYGYMPWSHTLVVYTFVFYLLCAYSLIVMPLPDDPSALVPGAKQPQLAPFNCVHEIIEGCATAYAATGSVLSCLKVPALYQAVFNLLLTVPLGMYLRYFFHRTWRQTLIIGFCTTLFFETTQLTGDWFIFPAPYRLFDVDDLIVNTAGAMLGFALAAPAARLLPDLRLAKYENYDKALRAGALQRLFSFSIDSLLAILAWALCFAANLLIQVKGSVSGTSLSTELAFNTFGATSALFIPLQVFFLCVIPFITKGQTLSHMFLKLRITKPDGSNPTRLQCALRYLLLLAFFDLPSIFMKAAQAMESGVVLLSGASASASDEGAAVSFLVDNASAFDAAWCAFMLVWAALLVIRAIIARVRNRPFVLLNGLLSNTRIMTESGAKAMRERQRVMDVADVVAWEKELDASGTSLEELMERAGAAIAQKAAQHFYTTLMPRHAKLNKAFPILILAGSGNNGGDGWVAARYLAQAGFPVKLLTPKAAYEIKAEPARTAALQTTGADLQIDVFVNPNAAEIKQSTLGAKLIIDAMLGTGFNGKTVREPYATWINAANNTQHGSKKRESGRSAKRAFVLAADAPSGLDAQTGAAGSPCIEADMTITMLALKPGLLAKGAETYTGTIRLAPLVQSTEP